MPLELSVDQRTALLRDFVRALGDGRVPVIAALHDKGKDASNPHVHVLLRDRDMESGKRILMTSEAGSTERFRTLWERCTNHALENAGLDERIDRRSYAARGIDRIPSRHRGPKIDAMARKGIQTGVATAAVRREDTASRIEREVEAAEESVQRAERDCKVPEIGRPHADVDVPGWRQYREQELARIYGADLRGHELARFFRLHRGADGTVILENAAAHIVDHGDRITGMTGNNIEVRAMLDVAQLHGWSSVTVFGTNDFKRCAMNVALSRGIAIVPAADEDWIILAEVAAVRDDRGKAPTPDVRRHVIDDSRENDRRNERGGRR